MSSAEPRVKRGRVEEEAGAAATSTAPAEQITASPAERSLALAGAWGIVFAHLSTHEACEVRKINHKALAQVAAHPWRDLDTVVVDLEKWRASFPAAVGARLAPSQVALPSGILAGLEAVSLAGWSSTEALAQVTAGAPGVRAWYLQGCSLGFLFEAAAREEDGGEAAAVAEAAAQAIANFDPEVYFATCTDDNLREAFAAGLAKHVGSLKACGAALAALHRLSNDEKGCSFTKGFKIRCIADALVEHVACESVCEAACWSLAKLNDATYFNYSPAGAVAAAMLAHPGSCSVAAAGCFALASFRIGKVCTGGNLERRSYTAATEAVRLALRNHATASPLVSTHGAAFLNLAVSYETGQRPKDAALLRAIWGEMLELLQLQPLAPELYAGVSGVFFALSRSPEEVCATVIEGGGLKVLVDVVRQPAVERAACYSFVLTLVSLCVTAEEKFYPSFVAAGGLQAAVAAVDRLGDGRYGDAPVRLPQERSPSEDKSFKDFQRATALLLFYVCWTWEGDPSPLLESGAIRVIVRFLQDFLGQGHGGPVRSGSDPSRTMFYWAVTAELLDIILSPLARRNEADNPRIFHDDVCFMWLLRLCERCPEVTAEVRRLGGVSGLLWAPRAPEMAPPRVPEPYSRGEDVFALPAGALKGLLDCFRPCEVKQLRLVSRDTMTHVAGHRWTEGAVQVSDVAAWRRCFPRAVGVRVLIQEGAQRSQRLTLQDFLCLQGLEYLDISDCRMESDAGLQLLRGLRTLKMSQCNLLDLGGSSVFEQLSRLRELDISGCHGCSPEMFRHLGCLEVLNVSGCSGLVFNEQVAQALPALRSLRLNASTVASSPSLRQLASLSTLTVTGDAHVREAVEAYRDWELLGLAVCKCVEESTELSDGSNIEGLPVEGEAILTILTHHRGSAEVCSAACRALQRVFYHCGGLSFNFSVCLQAVAATIQAHGPSLQVCEDAFAALYEMVNEDRAEGMYEEMAPAFEAAAGAVIAALGAHPTSVKANTYGAIFLRYSVSAGWDARTLDAVLLHAAAALRSAALQACWNYWAEVSYCLVERKDESLQLPRRLHDAGLGSLLLGMLLRDHPNDTELANDDGDDEACDDDDEDEDEDDTGPYCNCLQIGTLLSAVAQTAAGCAALEAADGVAVLSRCADECGYSPTFAALQRITARSAEAREAFISHGGARLVLESAGSVHRTAVGDLDMVSWLLSLCAGSDAACASLTQAPQLNDFISVLKECVRSARDTETAAKALRRMCLQSPAARAAVLAAGGGEVLRKFKRKLQAAAEAYNAVASGLEVLDE